MIADRAIRLRGVRVHNLDDIDLDIPHRRLVVICGVSGSGKSSLAFDTLYAEGQRRYLETLSAYTRQFLERLEKPDADRIEGVPATVAVPRARPARSSRSTVGTATDINDHLRLLFARIGRLSCLKCGREVRRHTADSIAESLATLRPGTPIMIAFRVPNEVGGAIGKSTRLRSGFTRAIVGERTARLGDADRPAESANGEPTYVIVDRLSAVDTTPERIRESLEQAFQHGRGEVHVFSEGSEPRPSGSGGVAAIIDGEPWTRLAFADRLCCLECEIDYQEPQPRLFSFNSPLGACTRCEGMGRVRREGADRRDQQTCPDCHGSRLKPEALATKVGGLNIAEASALKVREATMFLERLGLATAEAAIARVMLEQIRSRLGYLESVGLGYLSIDRPLATLSGGETQRVALTTALGSSLVNLLYVLDEPSAGLHPADIERLLKAVISLRNRGNSVVVVEHDETLIRAADQVIEIGPGAGERGGRVVFQGTPAALESDSKSLTGDYLTGRRRIRPPTECRKANRGAVRLVGARGNNLKRITIEFPLGLLCVVCGVSGSGKSTLVEGTLYPALCRRLRKDAPPAYDFDDVFGDSGLDDCILVDQSPIGRSPRSNPVTYLKVFDEIRSVFAETIEARTHNYTAGQFSFNVAGGRCEQCQGEGYIAIDMRFLADVYIRCPECHGRRYKDSILKVTYRGRNIAEILEMTAREAFAFFRGQTKVQARIKLLIDVGLDYLRLGQPANTLSGGEAQRLKLAAHLSSTARGRSLFILDEPTTGLHPADIVQLLDCFEALLAVGHSLVVVEHNLHLIRAADHLIELGPGPADEGGRIVAEGCPEEVAAQPDSPTGPYLASMLAREAAERQSTEEPASHE